MMMIKRASNLLHPRPDFEDNTPPISLACQSVPNQPRYPFTDTTMLTLYSQSLECGNEC